MSHTGIVDQVFGANVPDTDRPAQKVIVNVASPIAGIPATNSLQPQVAFFIPLGVAPAEGEAISWDARHVWWPGERVDKISNTMTP